MKYSGGPKVAKWRFYVKNYPLIKKTCTVCLFPFETRRSYQLTCGDKCSLEHDRRTKAEKYKRNKHQRQLKICECGYSWFPKKTTDTNLCRKCLFRLAARRYRENHPGRGRDYYEKNRTAILQNQKARRKYFRSIILFGFTRKECKICGKEYTPRSANCKTCHECRKINRMRNIARNIARKRIEFYGSDYIPTKQLLTQLRKLIKQTKQNEKQTD